MIRCLGGDVSWDNTVAPGATYSETDASITHQVGDRPAVEKTHLGRFYVQPQWVFDSLNRRERWLLTNIKTLSSELLKIMIYCRLPEKNYALGETLPPHLSPFIADRRVGDYVPPEEKQLVEGTAEETEEVDGEEDGEEEEDGLN